MRWMRLPLHRLPRDLRKNLVVKLVAVILGACPSEQWCAGGAPAHQILCFHHHFHSVPHSSRWGASLAPTSSREPEGVNH